MTFPISRARLLKFNLAELPRDIFNRPDGGDYESFLEMEEFRSSSVSGETPGVWSGRNHTYTSLPECNVFTSLEGNSRVISIRENYPIYSEKVTDDVLAGKGSSRNRVMTIDFVLTLPPLNFGGPLRYMGLSSKPPLSKHQTSVKRRASREQKALESVGWMWGYVKRPSGVETRNHTKLRSWVRYPIDDAINDSRALATLLYSTTSNKPLAALLRMLGRRLGIPESDQFFVLAAAYYLGFVFINHSRELDESRSLVLNRA